MANFVSNDNATSLMNAINQKKDSKPSTITWAEWIALTDEQREGTHYIITNVPARFSDKDAVFSIKDQTLTFTNKVATVSDSRITSDTYIFSFYHNQAVAQAAGIECSWTTGTVTFTVDENPSESIVVDILGILPALATPETGSAGHTIVDSEGTEMTAQPNMTFKDAHLTNNTTNESTDIEIFKDISESDFDDLDETDPANDGAYIINNGSDTLLTDDMIAHDSTHTVRQAIDEVNGKTAKVNRLTYTVTTVALANALGGNEAQFYLSEMTGYSQAIADRTITLNVVSTFCTGDPRYLAVVSIASNGSVIVNASLPANYEIIIDQIYI